MPLEVELSGRTVGVLEQDEGSAGYTFTYDAREVANAGPGAIVLSLSLPVRPEPYVERECSPFFDGLLPEDRARVQVARRLGVSARNTYGLLGEIGRDCIDPDRKYEDEGGPSVAGIADALRELDAAQEITALIRLAIVNFAIGNSDAHGKNFAVLYSDDGARLTAQADRAG